MRVLSGLETKYTHTHTTRTCWVLAGVELHLPVAVCALLQSVARREQKECSKERAAVLVCISRACNNPTHTYVPCASIASRRAPCAYVVDWRTRAAVTTGKRGATQAWRYVRSHDERALRLFVCRRRCELCSSGRQTMGDDDAERRVSMLTTRDVYLRWRFASRERGRRASTTAPHSHTVAHLQHDDRAHRYIIHARECCCAM